MPQEFLRIDKVGQAFRILSGILGLIVGGMIMLRAVPGGTGDYLGSVGAIGKTTWFKVGFYLHIFAAGPMLFMGWFQFSGRIRRNHPAFHRITGKFYVLLTLIAAAPGGIILAMGAYGGLAGKACFVLMSILWFFYTLRAWLRVKKRDIPGHQADMLRSYALAFGAVSLRLWMFLIAGLLNWRSIEAYALCAWLSWLPNLLLMELWIRQKGLLSAKSANLPS